MLHLRENERGHRKMLCFIAYAFSLKKASSASNMLLQHVCLPPVVFLQVSYRRNLIDTIGVRGTCVVHAWYIGVSYLSSGVCTLWNDLKKTLFSFWLLQAHSFVTDMVLCPSTFCLPLVSYVCRRQHIVLSSYSGVSTLPLFLPFVHTNNWRLHTSVLVL